MPAATQRQPAPEIALLLAQPHAPQQTADNGLEEILIRNKRGALLYVPPGISASVPAPLAVMLHGAGGNADNGLRLLRNYADANNLILLAPESRKTTWDIIVESRYGPDVSFIDDCLSYVFDRHAIDPARLALGGFSDGASYALSLGISNGQLFSHIIAFSPGFMVPVRLENKMPIFVSHGKQDDVLPIQPCSRRIVPLLQNEGFPVEYREFDGPHTIPADISERAVTWFLRGL